MFLHVLDEAEQELFAESALYLVHSDEHVDPRETALLESLHIEMGIDPPVAPGSLDELVTRMSHVGSSLVARVLLFELCGVVTADGQVHPEEEASLRAMAESLEIEASQLTEFVDYALRAHKFWEEARDLVRETS